MSLLLATALVLSAASQVGESHEPVLVRRVVVQGNAKTRDSVILNEVQTKPGAEFSRRRWSDDVQRVKDLGLFWTTSATSATEQRAIDLYINVEEKWTIIPLLGFDRTRDVLEWNIGLYDANFLGLNSRLGFRFAQKQGGNTYELWHSRERFGDSALFYHIEGRKARSYHAVYDQVGRPADEDVRGHYQYDRESFYLQVGRRLDQRGDDNASLIYYVRANRYALDNAFPERERINEDRRFAAPPYRLSQRFGLHLAAGRLHYDDYVYAGSRLSAFALSSLQLTGRPAWFPRISLAYTQMFVPLPRHNWGFRLAAGAVGSPRLEDAFYLGGLGEVRGFPDERFFGSQMWLANVEYRYPIWDNRYVLVQSAAFVDGGRAWSSHWRYAFHDAALSAGGGVRVIIKPIVGSMVRFDWAQTLTPYSRNGINMAISQFF